MPFIKKKEKAKASQIKIIGWVTYFSFCNCILILIIIIIIIL